MFEELIRGWPGEEVVVHHDAASDTWMFVCVHSTALGPAGGGTRIRVYAEPSAALQDAMLLSEAMTRKNAVAGLPFGGGKAVLAVPSLPEGEERRRLLHRYADLIASLGGTYWTASDMNTSAADMDTIAERCGYVLGKTPGNGGSGSSAPATAVGVFHGIRASLGHAFGSPDPDGRTVVVQGVGAVGGRLAELLAEAGARVVVADVVADRVKDLVDRVDAEEVGVEDAIETECDVLSPCAVGGVLNPFTIPRLRCRVVAGAANNQLGSPEDARLLREAGVLYAPDYVINAGGIVHLVSLESLGETQERHDRRLEQIGEALTRVFERADAEGITTEQAADRIVAQRLALAGAS